MGALWKFSNSEQTVSSLQALPHQLWLALAVIEFFLALGLILPALKKSFGKLAPIAAVCITGEMLLFSLVNLFSSHTDFSQITYWIVVAAICAFLAWGRFVLKPIR